MKAYIQEKCDLGERGSDWVGEVRFGEEGITRSEKMGGKGEGFR